MAQNIDTLKTDSLELTNTLDSILEKNKIVEDTTSTFDINAPIQVEEINKINSIIVDFYSQLGLSEQATSVFTHITFMLAIAIISIASLYLFKYIFIQKLLPVIVAKSKNKFDDYLVENKVFEPLAHIVPAVLILFLGDYCFDDENFVKFIIASCNIYIIISVLISILRALTAINEATDVLMRKKNRSVTIKGYIQVLKIVFGIIAGILVISVIAGKSPTAIVTGFAAMSAVIMLIFKDSISGFVASIQLAAQNMVKINDWITIKNRNANGNVIDITLNTIKVRNFDNSISTIPTASLMSESFVNWSNMQDQKARQIKRTIYIDANTIKIASDELIEKVKNIDIMANYVKERISDQKGEKYLERFANARITNIELFRKYIENYIKSNFQIVKKFAPVKIKTENGYIEEYIVNKEKFLKDYGKDFEKYLEQDTQGHHHIADIKKFVLENRNHFEWEGDIVFHITRKKDVNYINGEQIPYEYTDYAVEKDGIFVENAISFVRLLEQTPQGIPMDIMCFTKITSWVNYEKVQSLFMEQIYSMMDVFKLKCFQYSQGSCIVKE